MSKRALLAFVFHLSGTLAESSRLFAEAEHFRAERDSAPGILDSYRGYRYCDLLLRLGQTGEVLRRATQTLRWSRELLDIGLDHLALGRAYPDGSLESATHLNQAVDNLRGSGNLDMLPLALLARGTPRDLDEVFRIATRSGMRLHLTDYHLAMARLHHSREHFEKAETLIAETGYHRRDAELEAIRQSL